MMKIIHSWNLNKMKNEFNDYIVWNFHIKCTKDILIARKVFTEDSCSDENFPDLEISKYFLSVMGSSTVLHRNKTTGLNALNVINVFNIFAFMRSS